MVFSGYYGLSLFSSPLARPTFGNTLQTTLINADWYDTDKNPLTLIHA